MLEVAQSMASTLCLCSTSSSTPVLADLEAKKGLEHWE